MAVAPRRPLARITRRRTFSRILVATDLSSRSRHVLHAAIAFGRAFDASLELIHVEAPLQALRGTRDKQIEHIARGRRGTERDERIDAMLAEQCARVRAAGLSCITTACVGMPVHQILAHLRKVRADMLIVGTRAEASLSHLLRGHTGQRLAKGFRHPVVLIPLD